jgi:CBS domain containing-hemolysin-like protein
VGLALIVRALPLWRLTKGVRTKPGATDGEVEVEELRNVVDTARVEAVIDREEHRIITAAMSLGELRIRDIMVPWVEVIEVPEAATVAEGVAVMLQHRVSRAPIVTGEVVYVANLKDLLLRERSGEAEAPARSGARSCPVVPGTKSVARMMQEMQAEQQHLAAVADEYGKLCGIISLEDCLEELVGEIEDEHDRGDAGIVQSGAGVWFVPGAMTLRDLRKELGMSLDGGGTIGGFVFDQLGRSAVVGDVVESGGWRFEVTEMVRRRVVRIEMRRAARDEEA